MHFQPRGDSGGLNGGGSDPVHVRTGRTVNPGLVLVEDWDGLWEWSVASFVLVSKTPMNESQLKKCVGRGVHAELSHISVVKNLLIFTVLQ